MTIVLKLRCRTTQLAQYAQRFGAANDDPMFAIGRAARARGHVTRSEFLALCAWKTPRSKPRCARNTPAAVRSATRLALASPDEHIRVDALRALDATRSGEGVQSGVLMCGLTNEKEARPDATTAYRPSAN